MRHDNTNLKLLRAFSAVARHLSFSRAASELRRSQATLSVQVRELELQLNATLLERTTRRVSLTEAGAMLAEKLEIGFNAIDEGLDMVGIMTHARRSRIVMACAPSLSCTQLPPILASYRATAPTVRIEVSELTSREMFTALAERVVDFGLGPCPDPPPPDISFSALVDDPLYVVMPAPDGVDSVEGFEFDALQDRQLVTLSGAMLLQRMLEEAANERAICWETTTEVRHVHTAISMAESGVGIAVVPKLALPGALVSGVVAVPIINPRISRKVGLMTAAGQPLEAGAAQLAQHIRATLVRRCGNPRTVLRAAAQATPARHVNDAGQAEPLWRTGPRIA